MGITIIPKPDKSRATASGAFDRTQPNLDHITRIKVGGIEGYREATNAKAEPRSIVQVETTGRDGVKTTRPYPLDQGGITSLVTTLENKGLANKFAHQLAALRDDYGTLNGMLPSDVDQANALTPKSIQSYFKPEKPESILPPGYEAGANEKASASEGHSRSAAVPTGNLGSVVSSATRLSVNPLDVAASGDTRPFIAPPAP